MELTERQIETLKSGEPVWIPSSELDEDLVVLSASGYDRFLELIRDERDRSAWANLAKQARESWAKENPY